MAICKHTNHKIVEETDQYFDEVSQNWHLVPQFWIGDLVYLHSHKIRSGC